LKYLKNNKGEAYIDTIIKFMVFILLIAFMISIVPMFTYKFEQDSFADELMRTAELTGNTNSAEATDKINTLKTQANLNPSADWTGTAYKSGTKVQLGSNISLKLTSVYTYQLASFIPIDIVVTSRATGTSEVFWK